MIKALLNWWRVRKNRKALSEIRRHLRHILHVNDDILIPSVKEKAAEIIDEAEKIAPENTDEVSKFLEKAPLRAAKIFPKKSFPVLREYCDILAVAFSVAFGIRAIYLQPFKIPTSSMQPTLFGIHYVKGEDSMPKLPGILNYALFSVQRANTAIRNSGYFDFHNYSEFRKYIIFPWTKFSIGGINYDLPGDPSQVFKYSRMNPEKKYMEGEELCNGWLSLGDHLFVDRVSFHFREPRRGDVVVFVTEGLPCRDRGYFYIKRLMGMPGDTLRIVESELYIKEKDSDEFVLASRLGIGQIEKIYSGKGAYHGHLAMGLLSEGCEIHIPKNSYFMLGDNSANSSDSRAWGFVPRQNIIGRAFIVFWPLSRRWGLVDTKKPLDIPDSLENGLETMEMQ